MVHDSISDFIAMVNNAGKVKHGSVVVQFSKFKKNIADILKQYGYISDVKIIEKNKINFLKLDLKYYNNKHVIEDFVRVSKPSKRVYLSAEKLPSYRNGLGVSMVSTSKGLMTDKEARKLGIGGEIVCLVF